MLRKDMVEDGYLRGLLVHPEWYDGPQQQEEPFDPEEGIAIEKPAPDNVQPNAIPPVITGAIVAGAAVLNWTQQDTPWGTLKCWYVWSLTPGNATYLRIAQVFPVIPVDLFIPGPDLIAGDPPPVVTGLTYTDDAWVSGTSYYVTGTWWGQNEGLTPTGPSNVVTLSYPVIVLTAGYVGFDQYYGFVDSYGSIAPTTINGYTVISLYSADNGPPSTLNISIDKLGGVMPVQGMFTSLGFTDQHENAVLVDTSAATYATHGTYATWEWDLTNASPFANHGVYDITVI
jgi:hypothetical protein